MFAEVISFRPSGFANILTYKIEEITKEIEIGLSVKTIQKFNCTYWKMLFQKNPHHL